MSEFRNAVLETGLTIRTPEELAFRWARRDERDDAPSALTFPVLLTTAIVGTIVYGLTMKLHGGPGAMLTGALAMPLCAGAAWSLTVPAFYIVNAANGSKVDPSTTVLAALITVAFGSLALLASVPVTWFFTLALPFEATRWLTNIVVFAGVGFCMADVFSRVMRRLEPTRGGLFRLVWLGLLTTVGAELFYLSGLFDFSV